ncbi:hypothetical protein F5B22DRAFT_637481 [Xylaria bambusicola]|uniref:uncharacterized protein n=1 Tax=Xylaria bambusicola TaxID=326684 RepID=UPI002007808F|nr:uncharacterized protein F5B22DRAFT_637481 [Xylaria bambusicola]KAI0512887.1 hypothetical protein F5B22DRAFT_637481 [Xylaria bambusicola]
MSGISTTRPNLSRAASLVQCVSCLEDKFAGQFAYTTRRCASRHPASTCISCIETWIQHSLEEGGTRVTCPQCPTELGYSAIRKFADRATFEEYEMRQLTSLLDGDQSFVWCSRGCGSGQWHPAGVDEPILTCHHCHQQTCVVHRLPWHTGLTCGQFDAALWAQEESGHGAQEQLSAEQRPHALLLQRAREDEASRDVVRRTSKQCPSCHFDIAKIGGCDHMHCQAGIGKSRITDSAPDSPQIEEEHSG